MESCTILTTVANEQVAPVHGCMPVIVAPEDYDLWLNPMVQARGPLESILRPYPAERMEGGLSAGGGTTGVWTTRG